MIFKNSSTNYIENDKKLIDHILKGNKKALYVFYKTYYPKVLGYIKRKVEKTNDAEELLQDTFLAALDNLRDFQFHSSLYTYLCAIAKNKIIDYYRRKKISQVVFSRFPIFKKLVSKILTPDDKLIRKELKKEIIDIFSKLKPIYKKIILLKYQEEKTIHQIAEILKISPKSAESLLFRARKKFAKLYVQKTTSAKKIANQAKGDSLSPS